jgi:tetratricopeptide (TPR) repeat protein
MRKQFLILSAFLISMTVFGQKDELKAAQKAIDANEFSVALVDLQKAEPLISDDDQKSKAKYLYLKGLALYQNGSSQVDILEISKAFNELITYEKATKEVYTPKVQELLNSLITSTASKASSEYSTANETTSDADFAASAKDFYTVFLLSPRDTAYLDNAAYVYYRANDFKKSSELYQQLLDLNYTGIATEYKATDLEGKEVTFASKKDMEVQEKLKLVSNPRIEVTESKRETIYKNLAQNYLNLDEFDSALEVIANGRIEFPDSYELIITEANIYYRMDNKDMFKELLEKAISLNPTDPNLYYNVGVMNMDQGNLDLAISNFEQAIELNPNFANAYNNIGAAIIEKAAPLQAEMDKAVTDFAKYDKLLLERKAFYQEALPYYVKAYEIDPTNIGVVQTLHGLYENLQMTEELEEIHVVLENLREQ